MFGAAFASQLMLHEFHKAGRIPDARPATHTTTSNVAPGVPGAPSPHPEVPLVPTHLDPRHSVAFMYPGASTLPMRLGFETGEASKAAVTGIKEGVASLGARWDHWKGTLSELLADVKYVWWILGAGLVAVALYETWPVWSFLWEALMLVMKGLRSALHVLGWVWDGFTELVAELWSGVSGMVRTATGTGPRQ